MSTLDEQVEHSLYPTLYPFTSPTGNLARIESSAENCRQYEIEVFGGSGRGQVRVENSWVDYIFEDGESIFRRTRTENGGENYPTDSGGFDEGRTSQIW